MKCPVCGEPTVLVKKTKPAKYRDAVVVVETESFRCNFCEEDFVTPQQMGAFARAVKNKVRNKRGLLAPGKIAAIRAKLKLTQAALEEALGTGPKVVVKWESGKTIQSRGHDNMLRLLEREPEVLTKLQTIQQLRLAEQKTFENSLEPGGTVVRAI